MTMVPKKTNKTEFTEEKKWFAYAIIRLAQIFLA